MEIADGMRRGRRYHRLGLPRRVVVAGKREKPFGMRCWEQPFQRDPGNDAPALGNNRSFTRKQGLRDCVSSDNYKWFVATIKTDPRRQLPTGAVFGGKEPLIFA